MKNKWIKRKKKKTIIVFNTSEKAQHNTKFYFHSIES